MASYSDERKTNSDRKRKSLPADENLADEKAQGKKKKRLCSAVDVLIMQRKEECALDTRQRSNNAAAAMKDARIKLPKGVSVKHGASFAAEKDDSSFTVT